MEYNCVIFMCRGSKRLGFYEMDNTVRVKTSNSDFMFKGTCKRSIIHSLVEATYVPNDSYTRLSHASFNSALRKSLKLKRLKFSFVER